MRLSTCPNCHSKIKSQLRNKLIHLELVRYGHPRLFHHSSSSFQLRKTLPSDATTPNEKDNGPKSLYVDTVPPNPAQLDAAATFFLAHKPLKSWTATEWRKRNPYSDAVQLCPEIVFLGRSNSGKSSLLNALLQDFKLCRVGAKPGKTTLMHAWNLVRAGDVEVDGAHSKVRKELHHVMDEKAVLTVLDMPGYGFGSHAEWGRDILKYLTRRRQLRRAFVLINPSHGLKKSDYQTLELLRNEGISHQIVACKCDELRPRTPEVLLANLTRIQEEVGRHFGVGGAGRQVLGGNIGLLNVNDILAVGGLGDGKINNHIDRRHMWGLDEVRWAILRAAGLDKHVTSSRPQTDIGMVGKAREAQELQALADQDRRTAESQSQTSEMPRATVLSSSKKPPSIGIGIDELVKMTGTGVEQPKQRHRANAPPSRSKQVQPRSTKSSSPGIGIGIGMAQLLEMTGTAGDNKAKSKPKPRSKPRPSTKASSLLSKARRPPIRRA